jgi:hypothetical protein
VKRKAVGAGDWPHSTALAMIHVIATIRETRVRTIRHAGLFKIVALAISFHCLTQRTEIAICLLPRG